MVRGGFFWCGAEYSGPGCVCLFVLILSLNKRWKLLEEQLSGFTTCVPEVTWGQGHFAPRVM